MTKNQIKLIILGAVVLVIGIIMVNAFTIVGAGQRGVVLRFGAVGNNVLGEGIHLKIPFVDNIKILDVRIQKSETKMESSTKDLQDVSFVIAINHHVFPDKVNKIYQEIGIDYSNRIIDPSVQEVVKAVSANYTAEELITKREAVSQEIKTSLYNRLKKYNVIVDGFSIVDFKFSQKFTNAIEEKQTAEQLALKAERDLERIKFEAKQKIEQAKAEAEALRLKGKQVSRNLILLKEIETQLKAIEKWNGVLPRVNSGAIPFLNIDSNEK